MRIRQSAAWAMALGITLSACAVTVQEGQYGSIGVEAAQSLMATPERPIVLDVREPEEFAAGHVPGAVNVPLGTVAGWAATQPKDVPYVVICQTGRRSAKASQTLVDHGFTNVTNVEGGTSAWRQHGFPVVP